MTGNLRIAPMSLDDLQVAIGWAADEGWNPGLDDAAAFHAADPGGFLMGWLGDRPVAAISVVRHSDRFGFLGFYLCHPDVRGQGHGIAIWNAGMALLGDRNVGLDGVPDQQDNYRKSGFVLAHQTQRYGGAVEGRAHGRHVRTDLDDLEALLALDREVNGVQRRAYMAGWFTSTPTRMTLVNHRNGQIVCAGTIRACRHGHKIGPLFAPDAGDARAMIEALVDAAGAREIYIDAPDPNAAAVGLVTDLGLTSAFACARMYRGPAPARNLGRIFGETSFELG